MTAQIALLTDIVTELTTTAQDPRLSLNDLDARRYVKSLRTLARRVDDLIGCPQDTYAYSMVARIWYNMSIRFYKYHTHGRLDMLFRNLDDMYREAFEEELLEKLNDMTNMELKWIAQYSRNDRRLADLANEVLDRRSGV